MYIKKIQHELLENLLAHQKRDVFWMQKRQTHEKKFFVFFVQGSFHEVFLRNEDKMDSIL